MGGYAVKLRRNRANGHEAVEVKVSVEVSGIPDDHHEMMGLCADKAAAQMMRELEWSFHLVDSTGAPVDG